MVAEDTVVSHCSNMADVRGNLRESRDISWTVVMVLPSSGTLTFLLRDNDPVRCQKGKLLSGSTAVSLREVEERPAERAASLSEDWFGLDSPTGLFAEGQSWYLDAAGWWRVASEGLFV
jgi:hypothetical protein